MNCGHWLSVGAIVWLFITLVHIQHCHSMDGGAPTAPATAEAAHQERSETPPVKAAAGDSTVLLGMILRSCKQNLADPGAVAFMAYDTCGKASPVRNCAPGSALYNSVLQNHLGIPAVNNTDVAIGVRTSIRFALLSPLLECQIGGGGGASTTAGHECSSSASIVSSSLRASCADASLSAVLDRGLWMDKELVRWQNRFVDRIALLGESVEAEAEDASAGASEHHGDDSAMSKMQRGKAFMTDTLGYATSSIGGFDIPLVGSHALRDPALSMIKTPSLPPSAAAGGGRESSGSQASSAASTEGWNDVCFPIIFHIQWDAAMSPVTGKPRLLFHTTFHPWATAVALGMALCSPNPPIQVSRTCACMHASRL